MPTLDRAHVWKDPALIWAADPGVNTVTGTFESFQLPDPN